MRDMEKHRFKRLKIYVKKGLEIMYGILQVHTNLSYAKAHVRQYMVTKCPYLMIPRVKKSCDKFL